MAAVLFKIDWRLALDTLAVLPCILVVTFVFRHYVRDANRHIRTAIRPNQFLLAGIYLGHGASSKIFNREQKARAEFARRKSGKHGCLALRHSLLRALLPRGSKS